MKLFKFTQKLLTACVPAIATSVLFGASAEAATFAFSRAEVIFGDFNLAPESQATSTNTNTNTVAIDGVVTANSDAEAVFLPEPPVGGNFSVSQVTGKGAEYSGEAQSLARVVGLFLIPQDATSGVFKFNFSAGLILETAIDDPSLEQTTANGTVEFAIFAGSDPTALSLVDSFTLAGGLNSANGSDFLTKSKTVSLSVSQPVFSTLFGGLNESAIAVIDGSYERTFDVGTYITVVETKINDANAQAVPEPATILATALAGTTGVVLKRRKLLKSK
jgi:hypothetical protein